MDMMCVLCSGESNTQHPEDRLPVRPTVRGPLVRPLGTQVQRLIETESFKPLSLSVSASIFGPRGLRGPAHVGVARSPGGLQA